MATVVAILLNTVRPDFAFFGQKDAQQAVIIRRMVRDLAFDTEIVVLPTVREDSGLAISSRNLYLNAEEQESASVIHRALLKGKEAYKKGERHGARLEEMVRTTIETEPRVRVDYVSIVDAETLEKLDKLDDRPMLIAVAAFIGKTRLIDNTVLNKIKKTFQRRPNSNAVLRLEGTACRAYVCQQMPARFRDDFIVNMLPTCVFLNCFARILLIEDV